MKKRTLKTAVLLLFGFAPLGVMAQQMQQVPQMPLDPNVRYGKLENGLTYYIRHNELPKDRAEFYIAQRVGSVLEEDDQRGLAHFLEHMAFNGTKNFPGKGILNYLEKNGVKFGTNINAYTSIDETVYNLSAVPTVNPGLVDSCLLVLHDWSGFISLEDAEIDNERGVIHEEWRTSSNPYLRMYEKTILPALYPNSRYANRLPIGTMEVVDNFPYETLRAYYHKWYRPDLQAVIVVGDVDVDMIEKRIKEMWQDIPAPVDAAERVYFKIEDNQEPLVAIASDKEATRNSLSVMFKHDPLPDEIKNSQVGLVMSTINNMIAIMLNNRFEEITQKADAPFLGAYGYYGEYFLSKTKDAFNLGMAFKEGEWEKGLQTMVSVVNSAKEYGFTPSEYERAKAEMQSQMENAYNERDKVKNSAYVQEYLKHFTDAVPAPGIETEYMIFNQLAPNLPLEQVNMLMKQYITPNNIAIMMMGVEKEGVKYPSQEELLAVFNAANSAPVAAYEDKTSNEPLLAQLPKPGKVKKEGKGDFGTTVWTLSNGAKVIYKQTDFKKDQIIMTAQSNGGISLLPESDVINNKVLGDVITLGGVGSFSKTDLSKVLAGKRADVSPFIGRISEGMNGNCAPKDLETMLQLTYLYFTAPRQDQDAYQAWYNRTLNTLSNLEKNPSVAISDSLTSVLYNNNPAKVRLHSDDLPKVDYNRIAQIYKERFANAGDFTFIFVGNVDPSQLKPMVEQYIASLPAKGKKESYKEVEPRIQKGELNKYFSLPMETPKVTVYNVISGTCDFNLENNMKMTMLKQIMDMVYTETIREEEGGTYGVGTGGMIDLIPMNQYRFLYAFDTGEDKKDRLAKRAFDELNKVAQEGPREEHFKKVKEYMAKKYQEDVMENNYWMDQIGTKERFGKDTTTGYMEVLNTITPESIQKFASTLLSSGNRIEMVATGVNQN
ncbi:MAG: insulinase family protein [Bacteroidales bacterium]